MAGCGYQFTVEGSGPVIGGRVGVEGPPVRLAVHTLKNNTFEPNLEFKYTRYLLKALQSAGSATVVEDDLSADFILNGAIVSVSFPSLAFSKSGTQESRVSVKVAVTVRHRKSGKIRWKGSSQNSASYYVGSSSTTSGGESGLQFNRVLQDRALEQAGRGAAADLADRFLAARDQDKFGVDTIQKSPASLSGSDESLLPTRHSNTVESSKAPEK